MIRGGKPAFLRHVSPTPSSKFTHFLWSPSLSLPGDLVTKTTFLMRKDLWSLSTFQAVFSWVQCLVKNFSVLYQDQEKMAGPHIRVIKC